MTVEGNVKLVRRIWDEVWNQGMLSTVDEVLSASYVGHLPSTNGVHGREGFKELVRAYRKAFPDVRLTTEDVLGLGEKVVARWVSHGTHQNVYAGIPATGRRIEVTGISIFRLHDGEIQEEWEEFDLLALMRQLGVTAPFLSQLETTVS